MDTVKRDLKIVLHAMADFYDAEEPVADETLGAWIQLLANAIGPDAWDGREG